MAGSMTGLPLAASLIVILTSSIAAESKVDDEAEKFWKLDFDHTDNDKLFVVVEPKKSALGVEAYDACELRAARKRFNRHGKLAPEAWESIANLNSSRNNRVEVSREASFLRIHCKLGGAENASETLQSETSFIPIPDPQLSAPENVVVYFSTRRHNSFGNLYSVIIEWSLLESWVSRPLAFLSRCDINMKNGKKNISTKYSLWFNHYHTHHLKEYIDLDDVKMINCSVRAIASGDVLGKWSETQQVRLVENPPPRLILTYRNPEGQSYMRAIVDTAAALHNQTSFPIVFLQPAFVQNHDLNYTPQKNPPLIEFKNTDFLLFGIETVETVLSYPHEKLGNHGDKIYDFVLDWISFKRYEIRKCIQSDPYPRCIFELDIYLDRRHRKVFYESKNRVIKQMVANPIQGILFWTERDRDVLGAHHIFQTSFVRPRALDLTKTCNISIASVSHVLSMDWKIYPGQTVFMNKKRNLMTINEACDSRIVSRLPEDEEIENFRRVSIDWSYIYWLKEKDELYFKKRDADREDTVYHVGKGYGLEGEVSTTQFPEDLSWTNPEGNHQNIVFVNFGTIADIEAVNAESRPLPEVELLLPNGMEIQWNMTSKMTAKVVTHLSWPAQMRPPIEVDAAYRVVHDNGPHTGCFDSIEPCITKRDIGFQRGNDITFYLGGLEPDAKYYIEVTARLHPQSLEFFYLHEHNEVMDYRIASSYFHEPSVVPTWAAVLIGAAPFGLLAFLAIIFGPALYRYLRVVWETRGIPQIPVEDLKCGEVLSKDGNFGEVLLGDLKGRKVAVKRLKEDKNIPSNQRDFLYEAICLSQFNHRNIVKIVGIVLHSDTPMIVLEFWEGGNARGYLQRSFNSLSIDTLLDMGIQLSRSCAYLSARGYIHKDISLKNVLVRSPESKYPTIALADFGQVVVCSLGESYSSSVTEVAVRWAAPECLKSPSIFSVKSDVYSFGVALWEIFTYAQKEPFAGVNSETFLLERYNNVNLLPGPIPDCCPHLVKELISTCWARKPDERPDPTAVLWVMEMAKRNLPKDSEGVKYEYDCMAEADMTDNGDIIAYGYNLPLVGGDTGSLDTPPCDPCPDQLDPDSTNHLLTTVF